MTEETAARLREVLAGIDLGRADGPRLRGDDEGIGVMLAEIERVAPQAILQSAARVQLRALGVSVAGGSVAGGSVVGASGAGTDGTCATACSR
jgi:hypothetical protein